MGGKRHTGEKDTLAFANLDPDISRIANSTLILRQLSHYLPLKLAVNLSITSPRTLAELVFVSVCT